MERPTHKVDVLVCGSVACRTYASGHCGSVIYAVGNAIVPDNADPPQFIETSEAKFDCRDAIVVRTGGNGTNIIGIESLAVPAGKVVLATGWITMLGGSVFDVKH